MLHRIQLSLTLIACIGLLLGSGSRELPIVLEKPGAVTLSKTARIVFPQVASPQGPETPLDIGRTIQQNVAGFESQTLVVKMAMGQYAEIAIEWHGMDLEVTVRKPDGTPIFSTSLPVRASGTLPISIVADQAGSYSLEVRPYEQLKYTGSYSATLAALRFPTQTDRLRAEAVKVTIEGLYQKTKAQGIEKHIAALALWESANDDNGAAYTYQQLGKAYISIGDVTKSEKQFEKVIELRRRIGNPRSLAYTLRDIGVDYRSFDSPKKAIEYYHLALIVAGEAGDARAQSDILYSLGFAEARIGHMETALGFYQKALAIQQSRNDELGEARTLNAIGGAYDVLGEKSKALNFYTEASLRFERLGDRYRQAIMVNNIGLIHDDWGDYQSARDKYAAALTELRKLNINCEATVSPRSVPVCSTIASVLDNIGELSNTLGDPGSALSKFDESLKIRTLLNQPQATGSTLSRIAYSHLLLGNLSDALREGERALALNEQGTDLRGSAATLTFIGMAHAALNDREKAREYFERALSRQREAGDRRGEGVTLDKLGMLYASAADWDKALQQYTRALELWRNIKDADGETITLYNIARFERDRGNYVVAAAHIRKALEIVESTRATLRSQLLLRHYFAGKQDYYELLIDLNMRLHSINRSNELLADALEIHERAKARTLLDSLAEAREIGGGRMGVHGNDNQELIALVERQRVLLQNLNSKENLRREMIGAEHKPQSEAVLRQEIDELINQHDIVDSRIRALSPRYASLVKPKPIKASEIQQQLDAETDLIEYALGETRSYVWVVSSDSIQAIELPARKQVEAVANRLLNALTARSRYQDAESPQQRLARVNKAEADYPEASRALSKLVLDPIASLLGKKRLVIVADGSLQYVPFSALLIPNKTVGRAGTTNRNTPGPTDTGDVPLISKHEIVTLPSASVLALQRRELAKRAPAPLSIAILADPVFNPDDDRVTRAKAADGNGGVAQRPATPLGNPPSPNPNVNASPFLKGALRSIGLRDISWLPFSRAEAEAIMRVAPKGEVLSALDFKASRETASSPSLARYRIIHIATHGIMDLEHPELSGIVLSMVDEEGKPVDGYLRLHEIYNLNLPAELVVLSACQTGVGKQIKGEGLIALTRGFMYAGAKSVVASYWKVDDKATSELMAEFYRQMFVNRLKPAAALRAAQFKMSTTTRWRSPHYWAGFFLQGEWN